MKSDYSDKFLIKILYFKDLLDKLISLYNL